MFHHFTYEGAVDLESVTDLEYKKILEVQIQEYGQTPKQLFKVPHAPRSYIPSVPEYSKQFQYWSENSIIKKPAFAISENLYHNKRVSSVHKFDNKIISTGYDGEIFISKHKKLSLSKPIISTAISTSGILYSSISEDVVSCSLNTGKLLNSFKCHENRISCIKCPLPNMIVTGS